MTSRGRVPVVLAGATAILLSLTGFGGDGDDRPARRVDYIDALADALREPEDGFRLDRKTARCLAVAFVDGVGMARLREVEPRQLVDTDFVDLDISLGAQTIARLEENVGECPWLAPILDQTFSAEFGSDFPDDAAACLADGAQPELNATLVADAIDEIPQRKFDGAFERALQDSFVGCPDAVAELHLYGIAEAGLSLAPGGEECVRDRVRSRPEEAAAGLEEGPDARAFIEQTTIACREFLSVSPAN